MGCRKSELLCFLEVKGSLVRRNSEKWDVGKVKPIPDLSDSWDNFGLASCRTSGMSNNWVSHLYDVSVVRHLSDKWDVGQVRCRTSGMSDKCEFYFLGEFVLTCPTFCRISEMSDK